MAQNLEYLTIFVTASITKYLKGNEFGVPLVFKQQYLERDASTSDLIEVLIDGPDFSRKGSKNEQYGTVIVRLYVKTSYKPSDVYYHTRLKAKAIQILNTEIPLSRIGGTESIYDKVIIGFLRPLPTERLVLTPVSVEEPDGSIVEAVFGIHLC